MQKYAFHPIAGIFELMDGADFESFADDIEEHGLAEDIVLHEGKILDGRNRYRACCMRKVPFETIDFADSKWFTQFNGNPLRFARSRNRLRRQLTESQRATAAAEEARLSIQYPPLMTYAAAAAAYNVSERLVQEAATVLKHAHPELAEAMKNGHITTSAAGQAATLPAKAQRAVAAKAEKDGAASASEETKKQQASIIERKGIQLLKDAVSQGIISTKVGAKIANEPNPVQLDTVHDLLEKYAAKQAAKESSAAQGERKRLAKAAEKPPVKEPEPEQPEDIVDKLDMPVPERLHNVFQCSIFSDALTALNNIGRKLKEVGQTPAGAMLRYQQAEGQLRDLKRTLKFDAPYAVCPMCKAADVRQACACKGRGWLNEASYNALPSEYRL